ncbi:MAG: 30S ribosomal protein S8 [bacterium]
MTDPIADMFSRIKTALNVKAESIDMPHSKMKESIAQILASEGYIGAVDVLNRVEKKVLRLTFKYTPAKKSVINDLKRISKSGCRVYAESSKLPRVQSGYGLALISTSRGIMTDEKARAEKVGGEVVGYVW